VILAVDGATVRSYDDLAAALEKRKPGDVAKLKILRDGQSLEVEVPLSEAR